LAHPRMAKSALRFPLLLRLAPARPQPRLCAMVAEDRSRSPRSRTPERDPIVEAVRAQLHELCVKHNIPESHGFAHAVRVLGHVDQALAVARPVPTVPRQLSARLAALLHDADDRKYFPDCPKGELPNARRVMKEVGADEKVVEDALKMISLVSCSKNGNSAPPEAREAPELLFPRWADRLEATGQIGAVRCWQYNQEMGAKLCDESTPRPRSEAEVWELATPERFEKYQSSGGQSASMMDHYFDKLLRVARPPSELLRNDYFEAEMARRSAPLVEICLAYGEAGEVPLERLQTWADKLKAEES